LVIVERLPSLTIALIYVKNEATEAIAAKENRTVRTIPTGSSQAGEDSHRPKAI
jgi:hypothetical protein